jgi:DNA-binding XRE family transcriptional regulator
MRTKKTAGLPPNVRESLKEIGTLIACARKEKQWTQAELAKRIGVNRMTLGRIEKGAPEVAIGWYLTATWLLGLPILSWQTTSEGRGNTIVSDLLTKLQKNLPDRIRQHRRTIDNDF